MGRSTPAPPKQISGNARIDEPESNMLRPLEQVTAQANAGAANKADGGKAELKDKTDPGEQVEA